MCRARFASPSNPGPSALRSGVGETSHLACICVLLHTLFGSNVFFVVFMLTSRPVQPSQPAHPARPIMRLSSCVSCGLWPRLRRDLDNASG